MFPIKPDLVILPFKAITIGSDIPLTLEQTLRLLRSPQRGLIRIQRSHPGATDAIGWTIFPASEALEAADLPDL